jgi:DNA primase
MAGEWFTYSELAERLGISTEAVRQKVIRNGWPKRPNNRGKAEVLVDLDQVREQMEIYPPRKPKQPSEARQTPDEQPSDTQTIAALDAHIETLKAMVAKAEALTERERSRADDERGRADRLQARVEELLDESARIIERHAKTDEQIAQLRATMQALEEAARARAAQPWWRRLRRAG